ncbi:MAG TPA: metal-dependent transcriptional regulator [Candidatus Methanoperedens sp.]|nr:metal-dependent transcriptional regulator [Candidatus Methanoperedens sp.]
MHDEHGRSHSLEEALEGIWSARERGRERLAEIQGVTKVALVPELIAALTGQGLVRAEGERLLLTEAGEEAARQVIRRHRLAERLLHDILHMAVEATEESACEFEHMLADQVTESICTLLGHPRECPHGSPIPEGRCCREARRSVESLVVPLTRLAAGEEAKVAYLSSASPSRLHKLMAFGIAPGMRVRVHQHYPTLVVQCEHTQLAMEEEIARDIHVWREGSDSPR